MDSFEKANILLESKLSSEQLTDWKRDQCFTVIGQCSGDSYRLYCGGVYRFRSGGKGYTIQVWHSCCFHFHNFLYAHLPPHDLVLTAKLMLETDEAAFCRAAWGRWVAPLAIL